jgi:hypothetical protein
MNTALRTLQVALLTSAAAWLSGCSQASEPTPRTRTELLTGPNWRLTAATQTITRAGVTTTTDGYATMDPCHKDNAGKYNADMTFVTDDGPIQCFPGYPQRASTTWTFASNETELITSPGTLRVLQYRIAQLSPTTLELVITTIFPTETYVHDYTYTAF